MAKLIYGSIMSLDGCTEDAGGGFDWGEPSDEVFAAITEMMRSAGTYLYGRRMYETLAVWETDPSFAEQSELLAAYAEVWQAAEKVVYSTTLAEPVTARTRIERRFEPDAVRDLVASASSDVLIGGPTLAGQAFDAGLVDEVQLYVAPVVLAGGKPALAGSVPVTLDLLDERRFDDGVVHLRYRVT